MISRIAEIRRREERGFALITVLLAMLVMSALAVIMVQNVVSSFNQNSHQVRVTDALTAADAGLTDLVYNIQQGTNWADYLTNYCTSTVTGCGNSTNQWDGWTTVGGGQYEAHVDTCSVMSASRRSSSGCNATIGDRVLTIVGRYPATTGSTQTIQAVLRDSAGGPAAFNYAMFADKGIQIHHHSDSYISPTIVTNSIHSNGFITLNYPAIYRVGTMEAVGKVTIADGGGSIPSGKVTSSYNWPYWISSGDSNNPPRCYPALQYPASPTNYPTGTWGSNNGYWQVPSSGDSTATCSGNPVWSPNAVVVGDITANSVEVTKNGDTQQPTNASYDGVNWSPEATGSTCGPTGQAGFTDPITGTCISDDSANITAGSVKFDLSGQTFTGQSSSGTQTYVYTSSSANCGTQANCNQTAGNTGGLSTCTDCNQGTNDNAGYIGGQINLQYSSFAPNNITFPSYDYAAETLPVAETDQGGSTSTCTSGTTCHYFSSATNFLSWLSNSANAYAASGAYSASTNPCPTGYCMTWLDSSKNYTTTKANVAYVVLRGNYEITGGNLALAENSLRSAFGTGSTSVTPALEVAGALVDETGNISLTASLTVVGPTMDPFSPLLPDSQLPQGTQTVPGFLAAGGSIQSTDYDSDSPYTSTSNYQKLYSNTVIVRGLVYTASWSNSTSSSTASDQHWHNSDPKNAQIIVGAQIGATLHDCSNFTFDYDPLIENLVGFSGSTQSSVYVLDWTQL